jgi:spermidine/putrescine transport system permease protein
VFAFLYAPILVLIIFSFNAGRSGTVWEGLSLRWYGELANDPAILSAFTNTIIVAFVSTILATIIGTMISLAMERHNFPFQTPPGCGAVHADHHPGNCDCAGHAALLYHRF